jgi:hypothetical protein
MMAAGNPVPDFFLPNTWQEFTESERRWQRDFNAVTAPAFATSPAEGLLVCFANS